MTIVELIEKLETKTEFYIGTRNLHYLINFIEGYFYCELVNNIDGCSPSIGNDKRYHKFRMWILEKFNVQENRSIERVIYYNSQNETTALDYFFELWHEFLDQDK